MMTSLHHSPLPASANGGRAGLLRQITAYLAPYDTWHDPYQAYYREGLRAWGRRAGILFRERCPGYSRKILRVLGALRRSTRVRQWSGRGAGLVHGALDRLARGLGASRLPPSGLFDPLVGQYLFHLADGSERRVCIDSRDSGEVGSEALLGWCDWYFKTNYRQDRSYPTKVRPLVNGNPLVLGNLDELRAQRRAEPEYDLCFVVRVWGGSNEVEGIEHNLRLLEAVARVQARKYLLAYLVAGDIPASARRLEKQGIPWTATPMPMHQLWSVAARSRINVIRLGLHDCVPWRMVDLLALGACPVLDQDLRTRWPEPLEKGKHYLSLDAATAQDHPVADLGAYDRVAERLEEWLLADEPIRTIRANNEVYFDQHLAPEVVAAYLARTVCAEP
jgi:hypothetical protein